MSQTLANTDKEAIVKESLLKFLQQFITTAQLSSIDDIVLNYVVSILEDVGEESGEDSFDVDAFSEMMSAYIPEFSCIANVDVCHWVFDLAASLREEQSSRNSGKLTLEQSIDELLSPLNISVPQKPIPELHTISKLDTSSSGSSCSSDSYIDTNDHETVQALIEMFPGVSELEIRHCLTIANDDLTQATQVLLHRRETGQSLACNATLYQCSNKRTPSLADDEELKSRIIARYSYVDKDEDSKEHKPVAPKIEPKKLVRYRDNKIVSLKGERFTEVKSENAEETTKKSSSVRPGKTY
ncbi:CUE domain-containing protein 2 [Bemisia tabaci]